MTLVTTPLGFAYCPMQKNDVLWASFHFIVAFHSDPFTMPIPGHDKMYWVEKVAYHEHGWPNNLTNWILN